MIDSMPWHARSGSNSRRHHGVTLDVAEIAAPHHRPHRHRDACASCSNASCPTPNARRMVHEKEEIYRDHVRRRLRRGGGLSPPSPRRRHARGLKVGGGHGRRQAQHRVRDVAPEAWTRCRWPSWAATKASPASPTPAIFLEAARRIGVAPERCIVFEDAPFGIEAARRAGMRAVAVCSTHTAAELAGPHVIAARPRLQRTRPFELPGDTRCCMRDAQGHRGRSAAKTTPRRPTGSTPST